MLNWTPSEMSWDSIHLIGKLKNKYHVWGDNYERSEYFRRFNNKEFYEHFNNVLFCICRKTYPQKMEIGFF